MPEVKIVGRGVDTLVLNVCYADKQFQDARHSQDICRNGSTKILPVSCGRMGNNWVIVMF